MARNDEGIAGRSFHIAAVILGTKVSVLTGGAASSAGESEVAARAGCRDGAGPMLGWFGLARPGLALSIYFFLNYFLLF